MAYKTMDPKAPYATAFLLGEERRAPALARCNSRYSLAIRFLDGNHFLEGARFQKLLIKFDGANFDLGPCRLLAENATEDCDGIVVLEKDLYDIKSLFLHRKLVKPHTSFVNLPLLLAYKEKVKPVFKEYTANLLYDLNVYRTLFDELDTEYSGEPEHVRNFIQETILDTEGRKFMRFLDIKLDELEQIVSSFTREEHERHGFYFRKQLWNIICCSPIMKRTNLKPRGYAGDSEMMRMIYLNQYQGESTFSKLMHKHPLEATAARAVRQRRKIIAQKLAEMQNSPHTASGEKLKGLSVACGPAFELKDILSCPEDCKKYHFTLLDQDPAALKEAAMLVSRLERELGAKVSVDYLNASVRTVLARRELIKEWGQFDFVYSMGLFDYLTPPVATAVLTRLYALMKPGGWMLIGNFHVSNPSKYYMAYWNDWVIYHRTEEEFLDLLKKIPSPLAYIFFEETGSQMLLHVKKPARG